MIKWEKKSPILIIRQFSHILDKNSYLFLLLLMSRFDITTVYSALGSAGQSSIGLNLVISAVYVIPGYVLIVLYVKSRGYLGGSSKISGITSCPINISPRRDVKTLAAGHCRRFRKRWALRLFKLALKCKIIVIFRTRLERYKLFCFNKVSELWNAYYVKFDIMFRYGIIKLWQKNNCFALVLLAMLIIFKVICMCVI